MSHNHHTVVYRRSGFTLIELVIVVGILAIMTSTVIAILNPIELFRQARDASRLVNLSNLERTIFIYKVFNYDSNTMGARNTIYVSVPDPALVNPGETSTCPGILAPRTDGWVYQCVGPNDLTKTDGTGWVPIDFDRSVQGISLTALPQDPLNTANPSNPAENYFYTYATDGNGKFELNAKTESKKFGLGE